MLVDYQKLYAYLLGQAVAGVMGGESPPGET